MEFPIGKKLFHLVVNPGTSGCPTILFSEYEPLNKHCYYSLLDTYQLIQGQGSRGTKCLHSRLAKKQTVHRRTGNFLPGGAVIHLPKKFLQVAQIFTKRSKGN